MDKHSIFSSFFFQLYSAAWFFAHPWLRRNKRLADGWTERNVPENWAEPADLWIQAASGGEAQLAIALLHVLRRPPARNTAPDVIDEVDETAGAANLRVLVVTWTRQGRDVLEKALCPLREEKPWLTVSVRFAPLDSPSIARRAVGQVRPHLVLLLETELWPGLMGACAEAGVPVHMFNARMTRASYRWYRLIQSTLRSLSVGRIHAISAEDAARFSCIFGQNDETAKIFRHPSPGDDKHDACARCTVDIMPNIKFDRAASALTSPLVAAPFPWLQGLSPFFLLASVRDREETRLAPLLGRLFRQFPGAVVVIAPRHMHRVKAWMARTYDLGYRPVAASALPSLWPRLDFAGKNSRQETGKEGLAGRVLIWDRFGDLPRLYAMADAVFVGGSMRQGGQNFLEALAAGIVPCVGPSLENFRWALGVDQPPSLAEAGLLHICTSPRFLAKSLIADASNAMLPHGRPDRDKVRQRFQEWIKPRTGGVAHAARLVAEALDIKAL